MLLKTYEEMGEAGLAVCQASQIEPSSILAPGYVDTRWLVQAMWVQWLNNLYVYIYFASGVVSMYCLLVYFNYLHGVR